MCKRTCFLVSLLPLVCFAGFASGADSNLMGWWKFDGNAQDASGHERHGTIQGNAQFVPGIFGQALNFDGDDFVSIDGYKGVLGTNPWSVSAWLRTANADAHRCIISWGTNANQQRIEVRMMSGTGLMRSNHGAGNVNTANPVNDGEWHHLVLTVIEGATCSYPDMIFYIDGVDDTNPSTDPEVLDITENFDLGIGLRATHSDRFWDGDLDDVRLYDRVLTPEEVLEIMAGGGPGANEELAKSPAPADAAIDVSRDGILSWEPGVFAQTHDVYLGTSFDDVNNATRDNPLGVLASQDQTDTAFDPGRLEFGQTYYWRVDEVNAAPDNTIFKGNLWSFTAELFAYPVPNVTAISDAISKEGEGPENVVNGSGLNADDQHSVDATDMWAATPVDGTPVTITFAFERVEKLHEMLLWNYNVAFELFLGYGFKDVTVEHSANGADWVVLGDFEFAQATALETYTANTTVAFGGVAVQYVRLTANTGFGPLGQFGLSEVRFTSIPVHPTEPAPADGAADVSVTSMLGWQAGREAATHDVSLGTDPNALALVDSVADTTLDPGPLDLASIYSWQVVEVNDAETPSAWAGDVWSFTTEEFVVVDDFEAYDDDENAIFDTWIDGFVNDTGSTVGYFESPFAEQSITHAGGQSMPLEYDNTAGTTVSEATRTFDTPQDWTRHGIKGLIVWFYGDPDNAPAQLYVKIDDEKVSYDGDADNLTRMPWQMWYIDLAGVNVSSVAELTIGIEGAGAGMLLIDDIMLSPHDRNVLTPTEPDPANLVSYFPFDGDTSDSTGAHPGTVVGTPIFVDGKVGQAISLNGTGDYVELTGYKGILGPSAVTVAAWIKTTNTETGAIIGWGPNVTGQRFGFRIDAGRLRTEHAGGNIQGDSTINDGTWHHVAVTVEPNATISHPAVILWLDGQDDTRPTEDPDPYDLTADQDVRIGSRPSSGDRFFMGEIDELYIYDRVLSQAEIAALAGRTQPFDVP